MKKSNIIKETGTAGAAERSYPQGGRASPWLQTHKETLLACW
ncbi:rCG51698 [Rattus norvegicus]|uniref:RCG24972 n=1 Tax=Rattus norvegicus TaxID=10116 RepID=A6KUU6_RAT|nr:rCG24972 [Rattus norvegicus]EDL82761.1 rCG51698 [Rattus norvegicus]